MRLLPRAPIVRILVSSTLVGALAIGFETVAASPSDAATSCAVLPSAFGYSEFTTGTANESMGDSDGPTAFGGASTLTNFAIAKTDSTAGTATTFVAGGQINTSSDTGDSAVLDYGAGYADGNVYGLSVKTAQGASLTQVNSSQLANIVNFATNANAENTLASQIAALATTAGDLLGVTSTTLTLTAATSPAPADHQYVWDLPPGQLDDISTINIVGVPSNGSIVVNVPDTGAISLQTITVSIDGVSTQPQSPPDTTSSIPLDNATVFNFSAASSLTISGTWAGVLFAPTAAVSFSNGHVFGSVIADTLAGSNESTYGPLASNLCLDLVPNTALPDGHPLYFAIASAALLGCAAFVVRRRRRVA